MTEKNKNFDIQQLAKDSSLSGWLNIYTCLLLIVSLFCNVSMGEFDSDEIGLTSLLATDSGQNDSGLSDIQIPSLAEWPALPSVPTKHYPIVYSLPYHGTITMNFAAEVKDAMPQNISSSVDTTSISLERQLMESRISSLPQGRDKQKADELKQMIEKVRSVKLEPKKPAQQPASAAPVENIITAAAAEQSPQPVQTQSVENSNSNETLQLVENQLKDPNLISNPFELAEILFKSGRHVQAGICYKQALKVLPADDPNLATERAWILFQIGNCLKDEDPNTARESYAELIRTHPNSPWTEIAKARYGIIELYQQENSGDLIQQLNRPKP
jgi:TolA-binding protein